MGAAPAPIRARVDGSREGFTMFATKKCDDPEAVRDSSPHREAGEVALVTPRAEHTVRRGRAQRDNG